jgi:hypothetical protein
VKKEVLEDEVLTVIPISDFLQMVENSKQVQDVLDITSCDQVITFNNISVMSWQSVLLVEEKWSTQRKPQTCRKSLTNFITLCCIKYTSHERDSNSQH